MRRAADPDDQLRVLAPGDLAQHRYPARPGAGRLPRHPRARSAGGPLAASFGDPERPIALTVGIVDRTNLDRKGLRAFVEAGRHGARGRTSSSPARSSATPAPSSSAIAAGNVRLTGWLEDEELESLLDARARLRAGLEARGLRRLRRRGDARALRAGHRRGPGPCPRSSATPGVVLDDAEPATVAARRP